MGNQLDRAGAILVAVDFKDWKRRRVITKPDLFKACLLAFRAVINFSMGGQFSRQDQFFSDSGVTKLRSII